MSEMKTAISEERLKQLAFDPMICNITTEVGGCLRELVDARRSIAHLQQELQAAKERIKPRCPDCNSVGLGHCSDPLNCGGVYWPDAMYRALEQRNKALEDALKILREPVTAPACIVSEDFWAANNYFNTVHQVRVKAADSLAHRPEGAS